MDDLLVIFLVASYAVIFVAVLRRWALDRTPLNRDVLLMFGAIAGLFLTSLLATIAPELRIGVILVMLKPLLTLRLIRHFRPLPRGLLVAASLAFLVAIAIVLAGPLTNPARVYVVGIYVATELLSAVYLYRAATTRVGAARFRLVLASIGTVTFALTILVAGSGSILAPVLGVPVSEFTLLSRVLALESGLAYLVAFAPPLWFRRIQQRAVAFDLNQQLHAIPAGSAPALLWDRFVESTLAITGGRAAVFVDAGPRPAVVASAGVEGAAPPVGTHVDELGLGAFGGARVVASPSPAVAELAERAGGGTTIAVSVPRNGRDDQVGLVFVDGSPLFVDDDLALLGVLAARTGRAIDGEEALAQREALVAELRRTNDELARASAAKSDFLAAMSHELRTPLNSIIGFSELLMSPIGRDAARRELDVVDQAAHIHGAGLQLLELINEVLDLARIEAGRLELQYDRFDLVALVARTAEAMLPLATRGGLDLEVRPSDPLEVEADPARVRQVVYNLLSNAIKFTPNGGRVRVFVDDLGDGSARVVVDDSGPGIPDGEQGLVFEAFSQGAHGVRQSEGTGLGLALSRQLAEAHGGRIGLTSEVGRGSAFELVIPRERGVALAPVRDGRRLVLIVEDDPASVALLRAWLEPEGYALAIAPDGETGLDMARNLVPDAILLDVLLPGLDGWEVLQRLRVDRRTAQVPILIVSVVEGHQLGLALGAADFFLKPLDRAAVIARLAAVVGDRSEREVPVILAIDPDPASMAAYRTILDGSGRILEATTAAEARRIARARPPDIILLDLGLEDGSPFALLAELKAAERTRDIPVFAVASQPLSEETKTRLSGQVVAILEKTHAESGLISWLATFVRGPRPASGLGDSAAAGPSPAGPSQAGPSPAAGAPAAG